MSSDETAGLVTLTEDEANGGPKARPSAMAFYHGDGLIPAYNMAMAFAGQGGRIATMPDIWDVRLAQLQTRLDLDSELMQVGAPWDTYYTTASAEYMGRSHGGSLILIVTHGIGPMRDLDWMVKAYSHQFRDKSRNVRGGRIDQEDFLRLESGEYGEVQIIDLKQYLKKYKFPFLSGINPLEAERDELLQARLGPLWEKCLLAQKAISEKWHEAHVEEEEQRLMNWGVSGPRPANIFHLRENSNFGYIGMSEHPDFLKRATDDGQYAIAHLLSTGGVQIMHYCGSDADYTGVVTDVGLHSWYDGTRLIGVCAGSDLNNIHPGPNNLRAAIRKHWQRLGVPAGAQDTQPRGREFYRLDDDCEFALYQNDDQKVLQSAEPEFKVRGATELGRGEFKTEIEGYYGLFRYSPKDVRRIAPPQANAFRLVGDGDTVWTDGNPTHHTHDVVFYCANVDTRLRIPTEKEILQDFELTLELALDE